MILLKQYVFCLLASVLVVLVAGCDSQDDASGGFDIVGTWAVTSVEGAIGSVDASNSLWTFRDDGTYDWFFFFPAFYDLEGSGTIASTAARSPSTG